MFTICVPVPICVLLRRVRDNRGTESDNERDKVKRDKVKRESKRKEERKKHSRQQ